MPSRDKNSVQHECRVALLLIDFINDLEFDDGAQLQRPGIAAAKNVVRLKSAAKRQGIPCVYVNDNFHQWRSDFRRLVASCTKGRKRGSPIARLLVPEDDDYFVLKPMHSGFFQTPLALLLQNLKATTLILTGLTTDSCVLFTANDAYLRDYNIVVPSDCSAALARGRHTAALAQMRKTLHADTRAFRLIDLPRLLEQ